MAGDCFVPPSLVRATDVDVLARDRVIERRADHLVVRSPSQPEFYWGNFLIFDDAPGRGDGAAWAALFEDAFSAEPRVRHRAFAWDTSDGQLGRAREELEARGYRIEQNVGLVAEAGGLVPHERANRDVEIRPLEPFGDEELWESVVEVQVANRDDVFEDAAAYREFTSGRLARLRELFREGRGTWYVALDPETSEVVGSCGIVVTDGRGRYQAVDTAPAHRRRGICSRLVVEASQRSTKTFGTERFVIVADASYHALDLYESLGFRRQERAAGALLMPDE